jgi:hypothetical protein
MSVAAFADEMERDKARQRTYDALERKARALHVTGGRTYGHTNVAVADADGQRQYVSDASRPSRRRSYPRSP